MLRFDWKLLILQNPEPGSDPKDYIFNNGAATNRTLVPDPVGGVEQVRYFTKTDAFYTRIRDDGFTLKIMEFTL